MLDTYDFAGTAGIMLFIFMLVQVVDDLVAHSAIIVSGALHEMLPQARGGGKVPVTWPAHVVSGRVLLVLPESSLVWKISVATLTVGHGGTIKRPGLCKNALSAFICRRSSKGSGKVKRRKPVIALLASCHRLEHRLETHVRSVLSISFLFNFNFTRRDIESLIAGTLSAPPLT